MQVLGCHGVIEDDFGKRFKKQHPGGNHEICDQKKRCNLRQSEEPP